MRLTNFDDHPIKSGVLAGIKFSCFAIACLISTYVVLILVDFVDGGHGAGGVIGFIVIPIVGIFALPWPIIAINTIKAGGDTALIIGLFGGLLINGIIIGFLIGVFKKLSLKKNQ